MGAETPGHVLRLSRDVVLRFHVLSWSKKDEV